MDAERKIARELPEKMADDRTPNSQHGGGRTYPCEGEAQRESTTFFDTAMP